MLELKELELISLELARLELERLELELLSLDDDELERLLFELELLAPGAWLLVDDVEELISDELTELLIAEELTTEELETETLETEELAGCCDEFACDESAIDDCVCALDELPIITPPPLLLLTLILDERVYSDELVPTLVFELVLETGVTLLGVDDWLDTALASTLLLDELMLLLTVVAALDEFLGVDLPEEPPPQATKRLIDPVRVNLTKVFSIHASL